MLYTTGCIRGVIYRSATADATLARGVFGIIKLSSTMSRGI